MPNPTLEDFIDKLLAEKFPDSSIPAERKNQMKQDLLPRLNKMIMLKMLQKLSPDEVKEFQRMTQSNASNEALQQYLAQKIPNQDVFLAGVLGEFRELYLGPPNK